MTYGIAFDSTSADSSLSDLFSDDAKSEENDDGKLGLIKATEPSELSLILREDPRNSMVLLKYLKHYSELLFSWGETQLAVQACKLVADACALLHEYHSPIQE